MAEKLFVDTGLLVSAHDLDAGETRAIAEHVLRQLWEDRSGIVSTQVLEEFYVGITARVATRIARREARDLVNAYRVWPVMTIDAGDILSASDYEERFRLSFWDALVVISALKSGATILLSQAFHPYRQIGGLEIRNPFA